MSMNHDGIEEWAREKILSGNVKYLKEAHTKSVNYNRSHPTSEHFLPLIIAMAASDKTDTVNVLKIPILHRTISMESYVWSRNNEYASIS
ncbi:MAG: 4,5-DOPA dioxygenase extradiol [Enterobacterales bacterium]|jgi:4,5-DOPA dioxygenase extradiol